MLFASVCAGFIRSCNGEFWDWRFLGFLASLLCLSPCCAQDLGYVGVPPAGHAFQAEVGGGITFVITGGNVRQLIKLPAVIFGFMIIS